MDDAGGKVKLPQGRYGDSLPINANARNTSLRQPEGRVARGPRDRVGCHGLNGARSVDSGLFREGPSAINHSIPGPRAVSS